MKSVVVIREGRLAGTVGQIEGKLTDALISRRRAVALRTFAAFPHSLRFIRKDRLRHATDQERRFFEDTLEIMGGCFGDE